MAKKQKKVVPQTIKSYKKWRNTHYALKYGQFGVALLPETIMTICRWDDWANACGNHWSLGLGFTTVVISVIMTIFMVAKKQKLFEKELSAMFGLGLVLSLWAISFLFLAKIMTEFGYMLLCCACGVLTAGGLDQADKNIVQENYEDYKKLYDDGFNEKLNKKKLKKKLREEQAQRELEEISKRAID